MPIDIGAIAKSMFDAAFPILKKEAPQIGAFALGELNKLAQQIEIIGNELASGQINEDEARILLDMQKSAARVVLLTAKGTTLLAVEQSLNAALNVVKDVVNGALGVRLVG